ncbi:conserved hypothetical protein [Alteromonas sp. 38]|uniref:hypothetical protein n=1 Tax=unclassified Alteromonas TaxID=2614992 RepID=UPI0012F422C1|nr:MULTISPECIES: hypothetical protein [unclassified Alteromonas]CAD5250186.1 conserved hypothetical protein [Alteromonas sp. 154]VXC39264.1 conserved hypothetical protein [Alteromonas sp. 38]
MSLSLIAKKISKSRLNKIIEKSAISELSDHDPYHVQQAVANLLPPTGAWKAGGTNKKTQEYFGTANPYYGPIEKSKVHVGSHLVVDTKSLAQPLKGELEIGFLIPPEVFTNENKLADLMTGGDISAFVCVELPWTIFEQPDTGLSHLIADVCGANALLCGPEIPTRMLYGNNKIELSLQSGDETVTRGLITDSIIPPLDVLVDFIAFIYKQEIEIIEPIYLATGGISACVSLNKNTKYSVVIDGTKNFHFTLG